MSALDTGVICKLMCLRSDNEYVRLFKEKDDDLWFDTFEFTRQPVVLLLNRGFDQEAFVEMSQVIINNVVVWIFANHLHEICNDDERI